MVARAAKSSQLYALVPYRESKPVARISSLFAMGVYVPNETKYVDVSQLYALVPYAVDVHNDPRVSQLSGMAVYTDGLPQTVRSRAWTFVLDGHTFYVLDLGTEGTFLYDIDTQQWCQFTTNGHNGWNLKNGIRWGTVGRIVGGDENGGYVWELDPDAKIDEDFRDIQHVVTGNITTRSRVFHAVESVRVAGSFGDLTDVNGTQFMLRFSDDGGHTFSDPFVVVLTEGDWYGEVAWTSLGSFMAPGRLFEFSDIGGLTRIDGADVFIEDFDDNELVTKAQQEAAKRQV